MRITFKLDVTIFYYLDLNPERQIRWQFANWFIKLEKQFEMNVVVWFFYVHVNCCMNHLWNRKRLNPNHLEWLLTA